MSTADDMLLSVDDLCMVFDMGKKRIRASEHISLTIRQGETYGLVGESGSGKSTIGKCIIGLNKPTSGKIIFDNKELTAAKSEKEFREMTKGIQMIFQDPMSSLNPRKQVGEIIMEALRIQKIGDSEENRKKITEDILKQVGIPVSYANRYPGNFSGGQRQRIGIARALVSDPKLIIADECIAALDASVQAQIVNLLRRIKEERGTSFLFISHDLSMVRFLSDRIGVLHLGYLLEEGTSDEIFNCPVHPYTKALLSAIPGLNPVIQQQNKTYYNYDSSGIDYALGKEQKISDTHMVRCMDEELKIWWENNEEE